MVYSESGQDWHQFSGLIEHLNGPLGLNVSYVTSDPRDPGLEREHSGYRAFCIPEGLFLTIFFQVNRSDVFVLTMMDLDNLQLKRSLHPVHYVYLFHSMGSTHMVDNEDSFDHYETLFCAGPRKWVAMSIYLSLTTRCPGWTGSRLSMQFAKTIASAIHR